MTPTQSPTTASQATAELPGLPQAAVDEHNLQGGRLLYSFAQIKAYGLACYEAGRASRAQSEKPWLFIQMADGDSEHVAYLTWCADEAEIRAAVASAVYVEPLTLDDDETEQVKGITESLIDDGFFDFEGDPGLKLFRVATLGETK